MNLGADDPADWVHTSRERDGSITVQRATSEEQYAYIKGKRTSSTDQGQRIHSHLLREARPRPSLTVTEESSTNVSVSSTPRTSVDQAAHLLPAMAYLKLPQRKRGSAASISSADSDNESSSESETSKSSATSRFTKDISGFLEDDNIADWVSHRPGMKDFVEAALEKFDPNRKGHHGQRGMKTIRIFDGTASGKGDLRLGFIVRGNVFYPQAILSHKNSPPLAQRRNLPGT